MTEADFLDLITTQPADTVLDRLADMPAPERRAFAKPAMALFRKLDRVWINADSLPDPNVKDGEAVTVAVLATATGSELKKIGFFPRPGRVPLEQFVRKIRPDWLQMVVDHFVDDRVLYVDIFRPLWLAGLCDRPTGDGIILHYYSRWSYYGGIEEEILLSGDVWRFFEVEGGGEDSLANHDKYLKTGQKSWADRLKAYSDAGKLDRQRLLDASLGALDKDFAQYRAGWYSRFHVLMAPDGAEMAARADRYLRLLASSIPPTVSFALKHVQALDKAGALDPAALIAALEPALQARAKGTVTAALRLLQRAAKRDPSLREAAARKAMLALISEDAGVQDKALEAVKALGAEAVAAELGDYVDHVAPSVRPRIAALTGQTPQVAPQGDAPRARSVAQRVEPLAGPAETLALLLRVLEEPRDPFEVERAIDGMSRFGPALRDAGAALSPLGKRAVQICAAPGECELRLVLAMTGRALAEGVPLGTVMAEEQAALEKHAFVSDLSLQAFHLSRNVALIDRVLSGRALPMLSLPGDSSGCVQPGALLGRMAEYRADGTDPCLHDLALALMRLPEGARHEGPLPDATEADHAVAYALGREVKVGKTADLWAAAWCARGSGVRDKAVARLFRQPTTNCGEPTEMQLVVRRKDSDPYFWIEVDVPVTPSNAGKSTALPALFGIKTRRHFEDTCCGHMFPDIAWATLIRPADPEPVFRSALTQQEVWQKLTDNPTRAYLEPFFRPGPPAAPLGAATIAYYMACEDKSVSTLAAEAAATLAGEDRLAADSFLPALKPYVMSRALPTARWTKALQSVAELGAGGFTRAVITGLLDFAPEDTPRDIGGMLELCFELHVAQAVPLTDPAAIACLRAIPGGGKTARFSKRLLSLVPEELRAG